MKYEISTLLSLFLFLTQSSLACETPKKVVDYFMFSCEPMALFRMQYLNDVVDKFVIVEMLQTFSGHMKTDYCVNVYQEFLKPYVESGKAVIFKTEKFPSEIHYIENAPGFKHYTWYHSAAILRQAEGVKDRRMLPFAREKYVRDYGVPKMIDYFGNDTNYIVHFGDADEIPDKEVLRLLRCKDSVDTRMGMITLMYNTHWRAVNDGITASMVLSADKFSRETSIHDLRCFRDKNIPILKSTFAHAGWHCTKFLPDRLMIKKLERYAHVEYNRPELKEVKWIQDCRKYGLDLLVSAVWII